MLPKLILIVITIGATACSVLVIRQQRIDLAHDMANIHRRINENEQQLWDLRVDIHNQLNSETIRQMVTAFESQHGVRFTAVQFGDRLEAVLIPSPGRTPINEIAEDYVADTDRHGPLRVRQQREHFPVDIGHRAEEQGHPTGFGGWSSVGGDDSRGSERERGPFSPIDLISTPSAPPHRERADEQDIEAEIPSEA